MLSVILSAPIEVTPALVVVTSPLIATPVAMFEALPMKRFPLVRAGESLLLNVCQSVLLSAPVAEVEARAIASS
jgi:hypothetical protein